MRKLVRRVTLPALAEADDALGRKPDEALWPERYPADDSPDGLLTTRAVLPPRWWNAMYQQRPSAAEGAEILRAWWRFYDELPVPWEALEYRLASWDATFTDADSSDYVSGQVWGVYGGMRYLLDEVHQRMTFVETCEAVVLLHNKWKCNGTAVEHAANGVAIVNSLQAALPAVYGVKVGNNGKVARARAVSPQIRSGNVMLPKGAAMSLALIEECAAFPLGKHDDRVDAMSQALSQLESFQGVPVTHLKSGDDRFVPPHIRDLQQKGLLGGLGTMPRSWKI
jgi:predicted phage terminase large subunit-like protein